MTAEPKLTTYRVLYEIDIEAESAKEAAMEAYNIIKDIEGFAPVFEVIPWVLQPNGSSQPPDYDNHERPTATFVDMEHELCKQDS